MKNAIKYKRLNIIPGFSGGHKCTYNEALDELIFSILRKKKLQIGYPVMY